MGDLRLCGVGTRGLSHGPEATHGQQVSWCHLFLCNSNEGRAQRRGNNRPHFTVERGQGLLMALTKSISCCLRIEDLKDLFESNTYIYISGMPRLTCEHTADGGSALFIFLP